MSGDDPMTSDGPTDDRPDDAPPPDTTAPGAPDDPAPRVVDLRGDDPLPRALLREAYEERLELFARAAGEEELTASTLRIQDLEAALRPTHRLPRRPLEPSIFLG